MPPKKVARRKKVPSKRKPLLSAKGRIWEKRVNECVSKEIINNSKIPRDKFKVFLSKFMPETVQKKEDDDSLSLSNTAVRSVIFTPKETTKETPKTIEPKTAEPKTAEPKTVEPKTVEKNQTETESEGSSEEGEEGEENSEETSEGESEDSGGGEKSEPKEKSDSKKTKTIAKSKNIKKSNLKGKSVKGKG